MWDCRDKKIYAPESADSQSVRSDAKTLSELLVGEYGLSLVDKREAIESLLRDGQVPEAVIDAVLRDHCEDDKARYRVIHSLAELTGAAMRLRVQELLNSDQRLARSWGAAALLYIDEGEGLGQIKKIVDQYLNSSIGEIHFPLAMFPQILKERGTPACLSLANDLCQQLRGRPLI